MRFFESRVALSVLFLGFASWMLVGCGSSAVKSSATPEKPIAKHAANDSDEVEPPAPMELETAPLKGEDRAQVVEAIKLHDAKRFAEAARIFEKLREKHPRHVVILHELALTYRTMGQHEKAVEVLMPYSGGLPPDTLSSLGSALDDAGRPKEAFHVLRWGVVKYPDSGLLYSDLGVVLLRNGDIGQAMQAFHEGILAEPSWPSNYMNSAKVNSKSDERGLALMEGEMFRVLEPDSPRSEDIAVMMLEMYRQAVTVKVNPKTGRNDIFISLTKQEMKGSDEVSPATSFEIGFGPPLALVHQKGLTLKSLHLVRAAFAEKWLDPSVPVSASLRKMPLFRLHRALLAEGHFEAYDYWLLGPAFANEAGAWIRQHEQQMVAFARFMAKFPLFTKAPRKKKTASLLVQKQLRDS